jgi:hypothetical protein
MIRRPTWILLAIFVVVLAAAWLWQRSQTNKVEEEPTATPAPRLLDLDTSTIRDVKLEDAQGKQLYLRRIGGGNWIMTEPDRQNVDLEKVNGVVEQLGFAEVISELSTPPAQDQTGLGKPAYKLTITDQSGKKYLIEIGVETPTQSGYYIRKDGVVYVADKFGIDSLVDMLENPPIQPPTATATGSQAPQEVITGTVTIPSTPLSTTTP